MRRSNPGSSLDIPSLCAETAITLNKIKLKKQGVMFLFHWQEKWAPNGKPNQSNSVGAMMTKVCHTPDMKLGRSLGFRLTGYGSDQFLS